MILDGMTRDVSCHGRPLAPLVLWPKIAERQYLDLPDDTRMIVYAVLADRAMVIVLRLIVL